MWPGIYGKFTWTALCFMSAMLAALNDYFSCFSQSSSFNYIFTLILVSEYRHTLRWRRSLEVSVREFSSAISPSHSPPSPPTKMLYAAPFSFLLFLLLYCRIIFLGLLRKRIPLLLLLLSGSNFVSPPVRCAFFIYPLLSPYFSP